MKELINVRSELILEVLDYLRKLAARMAAIPAFYPAHLQSIERGVTGFDQIRQTVQVVEERNTTRKRIAEEPDRSRPLSDIGAFAYRDQPDDEEPNREQEVGNQPQVSIPWDEHASVRFKRALILGDPGLGKTWLLRWEARHLALNAEQCLEERSATLDNITLPVYLHISDVQDTQGQIEDVLVEKAGDNRSARFRRFLAKAVTQGSGMVLLDAWDEGVHVKGLPQRLGSYSERWPNPGILLATRRLGYASSPLSGAQKLKLMAFGSAEIERFIQVWFEKPETGRRLRQKLEQSYRLKELAGIPLMLALMCRAWVRDDTCLPERRVELYHRCLWGLLRDWREEKGERTQDVVVENTIRRTAQACEKLMLDGITQFTEAVLAQALDFNIDNEEEARRAQKFIDARKKEGLLIAANADGTELMFLHPSFQEYLAAVALAKSVNDPVGEGWQSIFQLRHKRVTVGDLVKTKAWDPRWYDVITLLSGQLTIPALVRDLIQRLTCNNLELASKCFSECPYKDVHTCAWLIRKLTQEGGEEYISSVAPTLSIVESQLVLDALISVLQNETVHNDPASVSPRYGRTDESKAYWNAAREERRMARVRLFIRAVLHENSNIANQGVLSRLLSSPQYPVRLVGILAACELRTHNASQLLNSMLLSEPDWRVRSFVAEAVGKTGTQEQIHALRSAALGDPANEVRIEAIKALGRIGGQQAVQTLIEAFHATHAPQRSPGTFRGASWTDWVRFEAAASLYALGQDRPIMQWINGVRHAAITIREAALVALDGVWIEDTPPAFVEAFRGRPRIAARVIINLTVSSRGVNDAEQKLIDILRSHKDWSARYSALVGLRELGGPKACQAFVSTVVEDKEEWVRVWAADALGRSRCFDARESMVHALKTDRKASVRRKIAEALGEMGDRSAVPALIAALGDSGFGVLARVRRNSIQGINLFTDCDLPGYRWVCCQSAISLGRLQDEHALPALTEALCYGRTSENEHDGHRPRSRLRNILSTKFQLWRLPLARFSPLSKYALPSYRLREAAALALGLLKSSEGVPPLREAGLFDESPEVRTAAAWALGSVGNDSEIPMLFRMSGDSACAVREAAILAIRTIATRRQLNSDLRETSLERLIKLTNDQDGEVREAAAEAFRAITSYAEAV